MEWYLSQGPDQHCEMGGVMREVAVAVATACLLACSIFGGAAGLDPLAGWGGLWAGEYEGGGGYGPLELELRADTAGMPTGVARFDRGFGMEAHRLTSLVLTQDSITTSLSFEGMVARIRGAREADEATGTFVVDAGGGTMDYGSWRLTRRPPEN